MMTMLDTATFATCSVMLTQNNGSNNSSDIQSLNYRFEAARPEVGEMQVVDVTAHDVLQQQGSGMQSPCLL